MKKLFLLIGILLIGAPLMAQTRIYIVPVIGTGTHIDPRRPKYFGDGTVPEQYSAMDYGMEPWMVVAADLSPADDAIVIGEPDAFGLPFDLTANLTGGQVTAVKNFLESINLPAGWVNTSFTWTGVLRIVLGIFSYFQRFTFIYAEANNGVVPGTIFNGGISLNSTFGSLPAAVRSAMIATAQDQNISTAGMTGSTTIRVILKVLGDAYSTRVISIGGIEI